VLEEVIQTAVSLYLSIFLNGLEIRFETFGQPDPDLAPKTSSSADEDDCPPCRGIVKYDVEIICHRGEGQFHMPMEKIARDEALSRSEFHQQLFRWLETTDDLCIGAESDYPRTGWVHVRHGLRIFVLNADTKRESVNEYLQLVDRYGNDLLWEIVESQRGKMTAVAYGPEHHRLKSFYLYVVGEAETEAQ
jgi:hypothetical protein